MKRFSSLLMGAAFVIAVGSALGTRASSPKFLGKITGSINQFCSPVTSPCQATGSIGCGATNVYLDDNPTHLCQTVLLKKNP